VAEAWFILDGEVRVEAIDALCDLIGWQDPEALLRGLLTVREAKRPKAVTTKTLPRR